MSVTTRWGEILTLIYWLTASCAGKDMAVLAGTGLFYLDTFQ